eukprot:COSAG06_NODE_159_length_21747_cov_5.504111_1_plen_87_part_10
MRNVRFRETRNAKCEMSSFAKCEMPPAKFRVRNFARFRRGKLMSRQHRTAPNSTMFGAGIDVSSAKAATAVAIWGAALHAMQCLMYR